MKNVNRRFPSNFNTKVNLIILVFILVMKLLILAEVNSTIRPMQLSNDEFVRILYAYKAICTDYPELEKYDFRGPKVVET